MIDHLWVNKVFDPIAKNGANNKSVQTTEKKKVKINCGFQKDT